MESNLNYDILSAKRLIIENYVGTVTLEELILLQNRISSDTGYSPSFNVIRDFRDTHLLLSETDILNYIQYLKRNSILYGKRRIAYLTSTPAQVVTTTMFNVLNDDLPVRIRVVSTLEAALTWVGLYYTDLKEIEPYIEQLKMTIGVTK